MRRPANLHWLSARLQGAQHGRGADNRDAARVCRHRRKRLFGTPRVGYAPAPMPTLLFVTVPTDQVLGKDGNVRYPGSEAAAQQLRDAGWDVEVIEPQWPKPLE